MKQRLIDKIRWHNRIPFDITDDKIAEIYAGSYHAAAVELSLSM